MKFLPSLTLLITFSFFQTAVAQGVPDRNEAKGGQWIEVEDLRDSWQVLEHGQWKPFVERSGAPRAIYFSVDPAKHRDNRIQLQGLRPYSIWVNGRLVKQVDAGSFSIDVDSLARLSGGSLAIGIYANEALAYIKTSIVKSGVVDGDIIDEHRKRNFLLDFSLLSVFILSLYFIALLRSNPRLTLDYFNVVRLFTLQERDESLVIGRITSSFSILVYVFVGLWTSVLLLLISNYAGTLWIISDDVTIRSVGDGFVKWGKLTVVLFIVLFMKLLLVLLLSRVFNMKDGAALQLLNFFRLLGSINMLLSIIMVFYFIFSTKAASYYGNLLQLCSWILVVWSVLIFLKLLNKSSFSIFHLISYLCASEFFPIIILFRVLFF